MDTKIDIKKSLAVKSVFNSDAHLRLSSLLSYKQWGALSLVSQYELVVMRLKYISNLPDKAM